MRVDHVGVQPRFYCNGSASAARSSHTGQLRPGSNNLTILQVHVLQTFITPKMNVIEVSNKFI